MKNTNTIAAYGGSFDPPTNGHVWLVEQAAARCSRLIVIVAQNASKTSRFSLHDRASMLAAATAHVPNVQIVTLQSDMFLVRAAKERGASTLVRGIRSAGEFQAEFDIANFNSRLEPDIQTMYLVPPPEFVSVSSSVVMKLVGPEGWEDAVEMYVPEPTFDAIEERTATAFVESYVRRSLRTALERHTGSVESLALDDIFAEVLAAHAESHRRYHRIAHVARVLREVGELSPEFVMAALYHDSVYRVLDDGRTDPRNESDSARRCSAAMAKVGFPPQLSMAATGAITSTALHLESGNLPSSFDPVNERILDADMSVFGDSEASYRRYARRIRQEYPMLSDDEFIAGRLAFLSKLLARPVRGGAVRIFRTDAFAEMYEAQAQQNVATEMRALGEGRVLG